MLFYGWSGMCVGIPMGINPAPVRENLYLQDYGTDFISSLIKTDKPKAVKFKNTLLHYYYYYYYRFIFVDFEIVTPPKN